MVMSNYQLSAVAVDEGQRVVPVEWLVWWTYQRQRADVVIDRGVGLYEGEMAADGIVANRSSPDGVYLLSTTGGRVDGGGKSSGDLHPDAELVHRTVLALDREAQAVVKAYVRTGAPPDPMLSVVPVLRPKLDRRGRVTYQRDRRGKRICAVLEVYPLQETLDMHRRAYAEWWGVMDMLARNLTASRRLETFQVTGVAAKPLELL